MLGGVSFATAFLAGVISFLSPCVLPLVPAYLSFVTGASLADLKEGRRGVWGSLAPSLLFVSGFALVFVALGTSASILGSFLGQYREVLSRAAGVLVLLMGLVLLGVVKVPWLYGEARFDMSRARTFGRGAALVMGMAFAFGWTPCVGPILASILALAGSSADVARGAALLAVYSLGLAVPFILTAVLFGRALPMLRWLTSHSHVINRVGGVLLVVMGVLILTDTLKVVSAWVLRVLPFLTFG